MSTSTPEAPADPLTDPVRLVCQSCAFEKTVEDAKSVEEVQAHEQESPDGACQGTVCVFVPTEPVAALYAITNSTGTAMGETALCPIHFADLSERAQVEQLAASQGDFAGLDWQDCSGNDALTCIACPAP